VTKGFSHVERVDYDETFALVRRYSSILMSLRISIILDLEIHQMDVKITFFYGKLNLKMSTWYNRGV